MDDNGESNLEIVIDRILFSARDLKKKLDCFKEGDASNEGQGNTSNFKDVQKMRDLERENLELRQALEDHQYGLEFIMSKYRSQIIELIQLNKAEKNVTPPETL